MKRGRVSRGGLMLGGMIDGMELLTSFLSTLLFLSCWSFAGDQKNYGIQDKVDGFLYSRGLLGFKARSGRQF